MHYYLYEIRNNINSKIYVGVHKTKVLDDGYMGSGKIITRAIEKHGVENFTKTILETFESQEEMFSREMEIVNEEFLSREDTYNLRRGGQGGFDHINTHKNAEYYEMRKQAAIDNNNKMGNPFNEWHKKVTKEQRSCASKLGITKKKELGLYKNDHFAGMKHTEETKRKIGAKTSIIQSAENNSQFGTIWITNGAENKKIRKDEIIPEGWYRGRNIKSH